MNQEFYPLIPGCTQDLIDSYRLNEAEAVSRIIEAARLPSEIMPLIESKALELVAHVRKARIGNGGLDAFLFQYDLSSEEGIALMCLAEALLRIPDNDTIDKLIRDKISTGDWASHLGKSDSLFVNAATWALMLTGRMIENTDQTKESWVGALRKLATRSSEPVIRQSVSQAMRILGRQFVMGRTIQEALRRAKDQEAKGYRYSYDMLGEAAMTQGDANRYFDAYKLAIEAIQLASDGRGPYQGPGISVKLSALHPRYELAKRARVKTELLPKLKELARLAQQANINFTIDAEESDRLMLSLELIEGILADPQFEGWEGFGLAVQAYQKRAPYVIDWLAAMARNYKRKMMIRLVKGAYWDTEVKNTQTEGFSDYAVYTRKMATDVSYIACVKKLLAATDWLYPQFATHNALTVATIMTLAGGDQPFEFQCLHGMGDALYDTIVGYDSGKYPCRIYAPVGTHEDLLAYLVRRLLENGANSSFVNRIIDEKMPIEDLIADPLAQLEALGEKKHPKIPLPLHLYGDSRKNSMGLDLANPAEFIPILENMKKAFETQGVASVTDIDSTLLQKQIISDPSSPARIVGEVLMGDASLVPAMVEKAHQAFFQWDKDGFEKRSELLLKLADRLEENRADLMALLVREAGKTITDAVSEVREAVDFCRYYAIEAQKHQHAVELPGPTGESNLLKMRGRGVFVCISPWNFPLAIFLGQVAAALVTGNTVIAKPAEQTSLIAGVVVQWMHDIGFPKEVIQLLPAEGSVVGPVLVKHPKVAGIVFTGSTETAKIIQRQLAERDGDILPFIAETGGQNCMLIDSSALSEQVVKDVVRSAFHSAGQRCSALRVLYVQEDIADKIIKMLKGAMAELSLGDPFLLSTDIGPVIDKEAQLGLQAHYDRMKKEATLLFQTPLPANASESDGFFFAPAAFEIKNINQLTKEVFGPILHVIRFEGRNMDAVIDEINSTGYGLTFGIHSRINETIENITRRIRAGNIYVNRNMVGAVVGVQPFGGEGLSGTGPKAGGPHYLLRFMVERTVTVNTTAAGGNASLMSL